MYSERILNCISTAIKILGASGLFPYAWDDNSKTIISNRSKLFPLLALCYFPQIIIRGGYLLIRLYLGTKTGSISPTDMAWLGTFMMANYVATEVTLLPLQKHREQVALF